MKPAFYVIFLTTLLGAGQGLFLALFTHQSYALFGLLPMQSDAFYGYGSALAMLFLGFGLIASFFHLGRPERAWRSATKWRTSWLSREVIALPAFMGVVFLYGVSHLAGYRPEVVTLPSGLLVDLSVVIGVIGTLLAFALFI
jgi:DMSO reductase anchor subunit